MNLEDAVHVDIYNGIQFNSTKEWNNAICSNMDGPRDYHANWNKSERERHIIYDISYVWNLIYGTSEHNLQNKNL